MPLHYYYPVPDIDRIKDDRSWDSKAGQMPGVNMNETYQLRLLCDEFPRYVDEYDFPLEKHDVGGNANEFYFNNHMFANTDAEVYYCMIRLFKPHMIIEIGGGRSTQICCASAQKNLEADGIKTRISVIEPYPNMDILFPLAKGLITLIESKVEDIDPGFFQQLHINDILFIDSSHVLKSGGDVNYLFTEILPRLNPGVVVHIHDIGIPYEVSKSDIVDRFWFFTEQYLLHAFLIYNSEFEILWGTRYMSKRHIEVGRIFRSSSEGKYQGTSFWIRRKGQ